jgi:5-methylcytosine-specific restriction endonuclease McrA
MPKTGRDGSLMWSPEEVNWLITNHRNGDVAWMAAQLGRSYKAVAQKLYKYRLSSTGRNLKRISINPKIQVKEPQEPTHCKLPVFHPVMIGIYPTRGSNAGVTHNGTWLWRQRRSIILKMHDSCCVYCGDEANSVDHVIPVEKGGMDNIENLVAACLTCNSSLGTSTKHILWITPKTRP